MLDISVPQEGPLAWGCPYCRAEGIPDPPGRVTHGPCGAHRDALMIQSRIGIWNSKNWPSNPPRVPLPVVAPQQRLSRSAEKRARHRENQRAYTARHRDRINAGRRAARAADPGHYARVRAAQRRWAQIKPWTTPGAKASKFAFGANQRAERYGVRGRLTATEVRRVAGPCAYCGAAITYGWDHVIPLALGGLNTIENLVSACWPCNQRKATRTPEQAGMTLVAA